MREDNAIDHSVFGELLASIQGDTAFLGELIDTYLADSADLLAQISRSLAANDLDGFRRAAHSLKSNSANLGATRLTAQARELEMMARAGSLAGAAPLVACLAGEYRQVSAELERLRTAA